MGRWAQYKALLWKNFLLKRRNIWATFLEIVLPCVIFASLVIVKHQMPPKYYEESLHLEDKSRFSQSTRLVTLYQYLEKNNVTLGFVPELETQPIRKYLLSHFFKPDRMIVFKDKKEMNDYIQSPDYGTESYKLHSVLDIENFIGPNYEYTIHMNGTRPSSFFYNVPSTYSNIYNYHDPGYHRPWMLYDQSGFMTFQSIVDSIILQKEEVVQMSPFISTSHDRIFRSTSQPFPTPAYTKDDFVTVIGQSLGFVLVLIFVWNMTRVISSFVEEKETLVYFHQKMMGLSTIAHISAWATLYIAIFAVISFLLCFAGVWGVYQYSFIPLIWLYYFAFGLSVFSTAYALAPFFDHAKTASIWSSIIFILSFFVSFLVDQDGTATTSSQALTCLVPTACLALTGKVIASLEGDHAGVTFTTGVEYVGNFSFAIGVTMLFVDVILYFIIGLYLNSVVPTEYGIVRPWYFPITTIRDMIYGSTPAHPSISNPNDSSGPTSNLIDYKNIDDSIYGPIDYNTSNEDYTEIEPFDHTTITPTIKLRDLRRTFPPPTIGLAALFNCCKKKKPQDFVAVKGLTLDLYPGVNVLLGANGAGKTTTFSMLSGLIGTTTGGALVNGMSISTDMADIYKNQGICFQRDVLYPRFTVLEHLQLYSSLKASKVLYSTDEERDLYLLALLDQVGLGPLGDNKVNAFASTLSGGQKRKLGLAIALLNDSKVVYCDEVSSGVDPLSQRALWEVILAEREKRTFVIVTHEMTEAEALADNISIIAAGKLICNGSLLYLKEKYGDGYNLTINKNLPPGSLANDRLPSHMLATGQMPEIKVDDGTLFQSQSSTLVELIDKVNNNAVIKQGDAVLTTKSGLKIYRFLLKAYPFARFASDNGGEIKFKLPIDNLDDFSDLLDDLEMNKVQLGVASFGIAVTSLTDVFLKVNEGQSRDEDYDDDAHEKTDDDDNNNNNNINNFSNNNNDNKKKKKNNNKNDLSEPLIPLSTSNSQENLFLQDRSPLQLSQSDLDQQAIRQTDHEVELEWNTIATESIFKLHPVRLWLKHFYALYAKRVHIAKRDIRAFLWQLLYPTMVLLFGLLMLQYGIPSEFKTLRIDPSGLPGGLNFMMGGNDGQDETYKQFQTALKDHVIPRYPPNHITLTTMQDDIADIPSMQRYLLDGHHNRTLKNPTAGALLFNNITNIPITDDPRANPQHFFYSLHFNTTSPHTLPMYKTMITNTLLAMKNPNASITVKSQPMPITHREHLFQTSSLSFIICIAFSFIPASFVWFLVKEKTDNVKHLQFINGISNSSYWISTFLWDLTTFIPPFLMYMALLFFFQTTVLVGSFEATVATIVLAWMFIIATCPFIYSLSFCFESHTIAQNVTLLIGFIGSTVLLILSIALSILESTRDTNRILRYFYRLLPSYCLGDALAMMMLRENLFAGKSIWSLNIVGWNLIFLAIDTVLYLGLLLFLEWMASNNMLDYLKAGCRRVDAMDDVQNDDIDTMSTMSTIDNDNESFSTTVEIDYESQPSSQLSPQQGEDADDNTGNLFTSNGSINNHQIKEYTRNEVKITKSKHAEMIIDPNEDADVRQERLDIENGLFDSSPVVVKGLRKLYFESSAQKKPFAAVGNLYFHVENECLGLIGPNGGGKSTTMKLITNAIRPTQGDAILSGLSVLKHGDAVRHLIGYVPQFDALFYLLTGREHLWLFARLKAIPEHKIDNYINYLGRKLGILHLLDRPVGGYSGGNKRKLQLGLALFGKVLCIDEASSGLDQASQRQLWTLISSSMANRSIILTSHHLDEIENLATRVGIMCSGRLRALGTTQHLKDRFGKFYQVEVSFSSNSKKEILHQWVMETFGTPSTVNLHTSTDNNSNQVQEAVQRIEVHNSNMVYRVSKAYFSIAKVFSLLNHARKTLKEQIGLTTYTVSDTRLDQIFVDIVREDDKRRLMGQERV